MRHLLEIGRYVGVVAMEMDVVELEKDYVLNLMIRRIQVAIGRWRGMSQTTTQNNRKASHQDEKKLRNNEITVAHSLAPFEFSKGFFCHNALIWLATNRLPKCKS
jgi:hypothetical protein